MVDFSRWMSFIKQCDGVFLEYAINAEYNLMFQRMATSSDGEFAVNYVGIRYMAQEAKILKMKIKPSLDRHRITLYIGRV